MGFWEWMGFEKPLGLLAETGGAKVGVTAAQKDAVTFDEIFKLYYALKAPYRKKAQFLCNEALVLQLMTIKDNNGNYIWKGRVLIHRLSASCIRKPRISAQITLCTTISTGWTSRCTPITKTRIWKQLLKKS